MATAFPQLRPSQGRSLLSMRVVMQENKEEGGNSLEVKEILTGMWRGPLATWPAGLNMARNPAGHVVTQPVKEE